MFLPSSRYYDLLRAIHVADGREQVYVRRRFLPPVRTDGLEHTVNQGDRLDNIAARTLGDPELFWRICDANEVLRPDELTEVVGRKLRIPLFPAPR